METVRFTVMLTEDAVRRLRLFAAEGKESASELVERLVRAHFDMPEPPARPKGYAAVKAKAMSVS